MLVVGLAIALFTYGTLKLESQLHHGFLMDDAYISLRYAQNFASGHGLVYNPGERVEGYTNFLMTLVMSVPFFVGCDPVTFVKAFGWLTGVSLLFSTGELVRRLAGRLASVVVVLAMALDLHFVWWCGGGLETMLVSALYVPALLLLDRRRLVPAAVLFALAALTRMETAILFVAAFGFLVVRRERFRDLVRFGAVFTAIFGGYFLARFAYYGWLFPNTYYAKVGTFQSAWKRGLEYLETHLRNLHLETAILVSAAALVVVLVVSLFGRRARPRGGLGWLVVVQTIFYALYVASVGGDHFNERFVYHFYPLLLATLAWSIRAVLSVTIRRDASLAVGFLVLALLFRFVGTGPSFGNAAGVGAWGSIGVLLRSEAKGRPALTATDAAGIIAYESGLPNVDLLGLCDEHIAHLKVEIGAGVAGHEKTDPKYVLDRNPDYFTSWIDNDAHMGRGFRRFWRFWRDYELAWAVRTDERFDMAPDRIKSISPYATPEEIIALRHGTERSPGNYDWGLWRRRTGPVPPRFFGHFDFGSVIPGATEHDGALVEVKAGHQPGHVMLGPGMEFPAGNYHVWFDLELGAPKTPLAPDAELCIFDVWETDTMAEQHLKAAEWADRKRTLSANFTVRADRQFRPTEIRLWCNGLVDMTVRRGYLEEVSPLSSPR